MGLGEGREATSYEPITSYNSGIPPGFPTEPQKEQCLLHLQTPMCGVKPEQHVTPALQ